MSATKTVTSMPSKTKSTTAKTPTKRDPYLIAVVIMIIVAVVFLIITLSVLFAFGSKSDLVDFRARLNAAGAFFILSFVSAVILAILIFVLISQRKKGMDSKGLKYAVLVVAIGLGIFILIASVLTFITANQTAKDFPSETSGIRAAGAFGLLTFLVFAISFIIILMRINKKSKSP